ncbi:MAG: helix-turn-helix transcriptional regulator [Firmicutes bacterium]|nr:helix-turn-helix transcriptional regulator [Bacillota bacterium]
MHYTVNFCRDINEKIKLVNHITKESVIYMENDNIYYLISQNIKKQRKLKGWTQVKLAMESNISVDYLKKIETKSGCDKQFSLDTIQKISKALNIDIKELFNKLD